MEYTLENTKVHKKTFKSKNGRWLVTMTTVLTFEKQPHTHSFDFEQELDYREEGVTSPCNGCDTLISEVMSE